MKYMLISLLLLASCASQHVKVSEGFVRFEKEDSDIVLASPDNVLFVTKKLTGQHIEDNNNPGLWIKEIDLTLKSRGYAEQLRKDISWGGGVGKMREYSVTFNSETYRYLIAVLSLENRLFLITAAGEDSAWDMRRESVIDTCKSFSYR
ncbi:MAG: hypothetical protein R6W70_01450 [bacterium]